MSQCNMTSWTRSEVASCWHGERVVRIWGSRADWSSVSCVGSDLEFLSLLHLQEMPRYHELPTLEERSGPLHPGATSLGSPIPVPPGPPVVEDVSLDLEDEEGEEEEEYLDKINPVYDALSYSSPSDSYQGKGFVMSRAMYV